MIYRVPEIDPAAPAIVVEIGNTHTHIATWHDQKLKTPLATPRTAPELFAEAFKAHVDALAQPTVPVVLASVVPKALTAVRKHVERVLSHDALIVGDQIPLPIDLGVDDPTAIGIDRVCAAAAAFDRLQQACTVVDFGSAVTMDLVNDDGVLEGGAILPGVAMQLRALHEFTAQLPSAEPHVPSSPVGRNTIQAMQNGVCRGIAGAVRGLVESYATELNRWPQVVATGGSLPLLAPHCDFLDTLVDHLVLRGVGLAYTRYLQLGRNG